MTPVSLQQLAIFLNKYKPSGRIADYGGTDNIGASIVQQMLALNNVTVIQDDPGAKINILIDGTPKKKVPTYHVLDYDNGVDLLNLIVGRKFDGGICMDLLEHVSNPFRVAENINNSLKKGAMLFVTVPMIWEEHPYPIDAWRFMPKGVELLFPKMQKMAVRVVRDRATEETVPRARIVGVFRKK